jgi:calcineurin-like phosphoesterase family protein
MRAWHNSYRGGIHLYGHSHGRLSPLAGSLDVGVDVWNFKPISKNFVLEHVAPFMDKKDGG